MLSRYAIFERHAAAMLIAYRRLPRHAADMMPRLRR